MKKFLFILLISLIGLRAQAQVINYSAHLAGPSPSEYQSGQYMFIDFWATWCIPCIKSMDHIEYLQSLFSDKVFFINMSSEQVHTVEKFLKKHPVNTSMLIDFDAQNFKNFGIKAIPKSVLLDSEGNILWFGHPSDMTPNQLKKLTAKNNARKQLRLEHIEYPIHKESKIQYETHLVKRLFSTDTVHLAISKYNLENNWIKGDEEISFQGSFTTFLSELLSIDENQLDMESGLNQQIQVRMPTKLYARHNDKVLDMFAERFNFKVDSSNIKKEALIIECTAETRFMDKNQINFGGAGKTLISESSIEADDMTVEEFATLMSNVMKKPVIFENPPSGYYDWNVHYKYENLMLEQFQYDYNTIPRKQTIDRLSYKIRRNSEN